RRRKLPFENRDSDPCRDLLYIMLFENTRCRGYRKCMRVPDYCAASFRQPRSIFRARELGWRPGGSDTRPVASKRPTYRNWPNGSPDRLSARIHKLQSPAENLFQEMHLD